MLGGIPNLPTIRFLVQVFYRRQPPAETARGKRRGVSAMSRLDDVEERSMRSWCALKGQRLSIIPANTLILEAVGAEDVMPRLSLSLHERRDETGRDWRQQYAVAVVAAGTDNQRPGRLDGRSLFLRPDSHLELAGS